MRLRGQRLPRDNRSMRWDSRIGSRRMGSRQRRFVSTRRPPRRGTRARTLPMCGSDTSPPRSIDTSPPEPDPDDPPPTISSSSPIPIEAVTAVTAVTAPHANGHSPDERLADTHVITKTRRDDAPSPEKADNTRNRVNIERPTALASCGLASNDALPDALPNLPRPMSSGWISKRPASIRGAIRSSSCNWRRVIASI